MPNKGCKIKFNPNSAFKKGHKIGKRFQKGQNPWNKGKRTELTRSQKIENLASRKRPSQCEMCGMPTKDLKQKLCFDHNHTTGEFRGWICHRCNLILGLAGDNIQILESAIDYLKKYD